MAASTDVVTRADIGRGLAIELNKLVADNIKSFSAPSSFPSPGEAGVLYVDASKGDLYFWNGSSYVSLGGETLTVLTKTATGFEYTDENGVKTTIDLTDVIKSAETKTTLDSATLVGTILSIQYTGESGVPQIKSVDLAAIAEAGTTVSNSVSGTSVTITVNGVDTVIDLSTLVKNAETDTLVQNTVVGHKIADYTNEAGVVKDINETVTTLDAVFDEDTSLLTITYVDENGVETKKILDLSILAPLLINNVIITNETGFHKDDGTITIVAGGGKDPLQYSIDGGLTFQSSNVFNNLVAGTYQIVVKNGNGDSKTTVAVVTQPEDLVVTATSTNETSFDANNGTITVTATGGVAPYTYSIDGVNYQSSNVFTGVSAGIYTVYGKDSVGDIHTTSVTIIQPADLTLTLISSTNETSFDANNGSITVLASGGVGSYSYSIDGGVTWQSSGTFNNLQAGTYSVIVKDQASPVNDTATVSNIVITQPDDLTLTLTSKTNETAFDANNGTIIVTAAGGVGAITYSINGGVTWQSSNIFTNLVAGTYSIIAKDSVNDTATVSNIVITQPDDLVAVLSSTTNESAFDKNDGTITVSQTGGVGPFTYSIDGVNFQSSPLFTGLQAGSYTVTVKDSTGDTSTVTATITQPADLSLSVSSYSNETAFDKNDGSVTVLAAGGVGPFTYSIDGGVTFQSSATFNNLQAGSYTIIVKDSSGDTATTSVTLTQPADLGINLVSKTDESVAGANDGSITVAGTNGVPGYQYSIDGGVTYQTSGTFSNLPSGAYTVIVKDSSGDTAQVNVTVTAGVATTVPIVLNLTDYAFWRGCNGTNNGWFADLKFEATYTDSNGNPAYALLTDGPGVDSPTTIYAKSGTNVSLVSTISDTDPIPTYCCKTYQVYVEEGGADLATGNLTQLVTPQTAGSATASYSFTASATRTFTAYARQTSDDAACGGGGTALSVTATATDETTSGANDGTITATGAGGTAPYEYSIDGVNFQASNVFTNVAPGTYTVTIRDSVSATATTSATVAAGSGGGIPTAPAAPASVCGTIQLTNDANNSAGISISFTNPGPGTWDECVTTSPLAPGETGGYGGAQPFNESVSTTIGILGSAASVVYLYYYVNNANISTKNQAIPLSSGIGGPITITGSLGVNSGEIVKILIVEGV